MTTYPHNVQQMTIQYNDYDGERATVTVDGVLLTAANFDAQNTAALAFRDAIAAITLGLRVGFSFGNKYETVDPKTMADTPLAQRELKMRVRYQETGANIHKMEIPCPDLTYLDPDNRGFFNLADTDVAAFVSAFEAYVRGPELNAATTVLDIQLVGKNI